MDRTEILAEVIDCVVEFGEVSLETVTAETMLIGSRAAVKSRALVEILLAGEDLAEEKLDAEFDWTSDAALSQRLSIFRTVGTLADHLASLTDNG